MRIVVAGGSGFIGKALVKHLVEEGHQVTVLDRSPRQVEGAITAQWDGEHLGPWVSVLDGADALINLSGAPIASRWTNENKELILKSRTASTLILGKAMAQVVSAPRVWINSSASGFYGNRGDEILDESASRGEGFLADVCVAWEQSLLDAEVLCRKVRLRTGVVLGKGGGALKALVPLTKMFLGGAIGDGSQYLPWIHLDDLVALYAWALTHAETEILNGSAPNPVTNKEFMHELRHELHRPPAIPAPAFALEALESAVGFPAETVLFGQNMVPAAALAAGFNFKHSELKSALQAELDDNKGQ